MKKLLLIIQIFAFMTFISPLYSQNVTTSKIHSISDTCLQNQDGNYKRKEVLDTLAAKLNYLAKYYKVNHPLGYSVKSENFYNFFVYDLVDTTNNSKSSCIQFIDKHIYHFSSLNARFLYSNIVILDSGKMYFFLGINCKNKINTIEETIGFLRCSFKNDPRLLEIISRVKRFKEYGLFYKTDPMSGTICEER